MKLQQLRFLAAIAQSELNVTAAAAKLHTTQPAISKQIRLLENELGFDIFVRSGRTLSKITPLGDRVVQSAIKVLREAQSIKSISAEHRDESHGTLSIGTTHTQARYVLPRVIGELRARYPRVQIHLHQGTSEQIADMARSSRIDLAVATGGAALFDQWLLLPCYRWNRSIIMPSSHVLAGVDEVTLEKLAPHPIVTYAFSFSGESSLLRAFEAAGLQPNVALTALDADVIKAYVRLGMGVGIVANMALEADCDSDLIARDASRIFPAMTTWVGFTRGAMLRRYAYDFIALLAPHLSRDSVDRAAKAREQQRVDALFAEVALPVR